MSIAPSVDTLPHKGGSPVSRFSSMFSQLLKLFPRTEFQALVKRTYAVRSWREHHVMLRRCFAKTSDFLRIARETKSTRGRRRTERSRAVREAALREERPFGCPERGSICRQE